ncbi:MAG TPA: ankyrin repeat domain-containing protein [Fimbriimonas sp.]|nr:ankyrin repeat domain-containing protein [Fimbriimonas sp.]
MNISKLPERPSSEYLKKLAKDRLGELRRKDPAAKLAQALHLVAQEHGFSSWRELKAELNRRKGELSERFFEACRQGDIASLEDLLKTDPELVHLRDRSGSTGLHAAAWRGHAEAVRLLLGHGADPNARDEGDNAYPIHFAAAAGHLGIVRALLDAGGDVHGFGDLHRGDVIGWATGWGFPSVRQDVVNLLLERGARHNVFSAIAAGDLQALQDLAEHNPDALDRRMSRFEQGQTALHYALQVRRPDILRLLLELGADVAATNDRNQTALEAAMLAGDHESIQYLLAAGAEPPSIAGDRNLRESVADLAGSVAKTVSMISVRDVSRSLDWYRSIGFREVSRFGDGGIVNFGMVAFGAAEIMLAPASAGPDQRQNVSLWFYTDRVDDLYQAFKNQQLSSAQSSLAGRDEMAIAFEEDINDTFYGAREFGIRDPDGYALYFIQPMT